MHVIYQVVKAKKGQSTAGLSNLSLGERKATLRQTDSIVQDIVSFEPVIQSVTSKAEDLLQAQPASEISTKYETLSKQAKELYAKQKETVEQHQAFIDAGWCLNCEINILKTFTDSFVLNFNYYIKNCRQ